MGTVREDFGKKELGIAAEPQKNALGFLRCEMSSDQCKKIKVVSKFILVSIIVVGLSCSTPKPKLIIESDGETITKEEYEVFLAVLKNRDKHPIIVDGKPTTSKSSIDYGFLRDHFEDLTSDTIRNLELQNTKPYSTEIKVRSRNGFPLVAQERWLDREYEYDTFYLFSRVGFSEDGKQAVVFLETKCQPLCAGFTVHFLTRENKTWTVQKDWIFWKS